MTDKKPDDLIKAQEFLVQVAQELKLDTSIVQATMPYLLGMTKHVAHDVVRPAAPLAAFLVGLAAQDTDPASVHAAIEKVEALVQERRLEG